MTVITDIKRRDIQKTLLAGKLPGTADFVYILQNYILLSPFFTSCAKSTAPITYLT